MSQQPQARILIYLKKRNFWRSFYYFIFIFIGEIHCCIMGVSFSAEFFFAAAALISFGTVVMCSLSLVRRQGNACLPGCVWCYVHSRPRHVAELGFKAVILPLSAGRAAYCVRM